MIQAVNHITDKSKPTREMMDILFKYFLSDLTLRNFYILTDPAECAKYVVFLGSRLEPLFHDLKVVPSKGRDGTIYFQSIKRFTNPTPADSSDRQDICLFIAYYYVRIFQIYCALELTLIDNVKAFVESGFYQTYADYLNRLNQYNVQLGDPFGTPGAPFGPRTIQRGGAEVVAIEGKTGRDRRAEVLLGESELQFLLDPSIIQNKNETSKPLPVRYREDTTISKQITTGFKTLINNVYVNLNNPKTTDSLEEEDKGFFAFLLPDVTKIYMIVQLPFTSKMDRVSSNVKLTFDSQMTICTYKKNVKMSTDVVLTILSSLLNRTPDQKMLELDLIGTAPNRFYYIKNTLPQITINGVLIELHKYFTKSMDSFFKEMETADRTIDTPDDVLERSMEVSQALLRGRRNIQGEQGVQYDDRTPLRPQGSDRFILSDAKTPGPLQLGKIIAPLQSTRPPAYCISRALRLLTAVQQAVPPEWKTMVCDNKFLIDSKGGVHDGAPLLNKTIDSSPGLLALSKLFHDTVSAINPDSVTMSKTSLAEYSTFLTRMSALYTNKPDTIDPRVTPLSKITPSYIKGVCATQPLTTVPAEILDDTWKRVKNLLYIQLLHSAKCGLIIKKMFYLKKLANGSFYVSIHPTLIKGGIPELDRITVEARKVLSQYYVDCETKYKEGVVAIAKAVEDKKQGQQQQQQQQQQQKPQQQPQQQQQRLNRGNTSKRRVQFAEGGNRKTRKRQ